MPNEKLDIIQSGIIRKPDWIWDGYSAFFLRNASGVLYITKNSPQYLSGHLRLRGRDNGQYPYKYKELIDELFGSSELKTVIEVCSGNISPGLDIYTVDINPDKHPSLVCDGQKLPDNLVNKFERWYCDPPYNTKTASKMYSTELPSFSKLLTAGAKVVQPEGLLFFLLGNVNMQWRPPSLTRIGLLFCTIVPNQEVRNLHIYYKHP